MSTSASLNGVTFAIPAPGEDGWGTEVANYLVALSTGVLQKAGGSFTLTAEVDFGATYGLKSAYFKSRGTVAAAGQVRLANAESVSWRNAANGADLALSVNSSNALTFNGIAIPNLALGTANQILGVNNGATANEYKTVTGTANQVTVTHGANSITLATPQSIGTGSSPTFAGMTLTSFSGVVKATAGVLSAATIVNADVSASAAIAYSKLALTGAILNADLAGSIALSKLAATTVSRALVSDGSGVITPATTTATEIGYVNGVTSAIQTQIDGKQPLDSDLTALAALASTGLIARTGSGTVSARTVTAGSSKIAVTNGDGVSGNPTVDVTEANLTHDNIGGTLSLTKGGTGQITANAALNALLPSQGSNANKVLTTDGSNTSWTAVATTVTTIRGDLIRRGAAADERFAAVTNNRVVRGNGTDVVSGQIDDPGFFTTGAAAASGAIGIVTTADQTFAGRKSSTNSKVSVYMSGNILVTTGTETTIPFNTEDTDTNNEFASVTVATTNLTCTSGSPTATVASATGIAAGQIIVSGNTTAGTRVKSISGTTVTLSANATASTTASGAFSEARFTPTRAGWYLVVLNIEADPTADATRSNVSLKKNGSLVQGFQHYHLSPGVTSTDHLYTVTGMFSLNGTTDYVSAYFSHSHGSDRTLYGSSDSTRLLVTELF